MRDVHLAGGGVGVCGVRLFSVYGEGETEREGYMGREREIRRGGERERDSG